VSSTLTAVPQLEFAVTAARALPRAAVPTIALSLAIETLAGPPVRSLTLGVRVDIAPARRAYGEHEEARLSDLFGVPALWEGTLGALPWTRGTVLVGPFSERASAEVPLPCSYDFEVAAAKYLHALGDGEIPIELMFSGTVLYADAERGVQAAPIPWDREAAYRLPVATWREAMRGVFGDSAWLRLPRGTFERLCAYRRALGAPDWAQAIEALLEGPR
jgi:hypothetical protein